MGTQQSHYDTSDPQIYLYSIRWCSDATSFSANIDLHNHTSKGIVKIDLEVVDKISGNPDYSSYSNIKNLILKCSKEDFKNIYVKSLFRISANSNIEIDGNYHFKSSEVFVKRNGEHSYIYFYLSFISRYQLKSLIVEKAKNIVSALTVLSQNLFTFDFNSEMIEYKGKDIYEINNDKSGSYSDELSYIDIGDLIIDGKLIFPKHSDAVLKVMLSCKQYIQSSRRFHEAILMRNGSLAQSAMSSLSGGYATQYELLAYVSSIEALLDTSKVIEEVECTECGHKTENREYKISKKFNDFVSTYSDQNPVVIDAMKRLYTDRSKFVHTGHDLHFYAARGQGGPFTLLGKSERREVPFYYFHVQEFTGVLIRIFYLRKLRL